VSGIVQENKMKKASTSRSGPFLVAAIATGCALVAGSSSPSFADDPGPQRAGDAFDTKTPIKHVVVIFQENISFDHYFGTYPQAANPPAEPKFVARPNTPAVDGFPAELLTNNPNKNAAGTTINPFLLVRDQVVCSQDHAYTDEQTAEDDGRMDQFVQVAFVNGHTTGNCAPDGSTVMGYVDGNTVTAMWHYAQHYAMSDNSYGSTFGPSTPGAINLISGQTYGVPQNLTLGNTTGDVTFDPATNVGAITGDPDPLFDDCGSPDQAGLPDANRNVGDLLNARGITWGWFQGGFAPSTPAQLDANGNVVTPAVCATTTQGHPGIDPTNPSDPVHAPITAYVAHHNPFEYYAHSANPHHLPPSAPHRIGETDQANHQYDLGDFWTAVDSGHMPAVSYLKAAAAEDGHSSNSDPLSEQIFVVDTINKLQKRPEWESTLVIISYDDSDGWYDHVPAVLVNGSASAADDYSGAGLCGKAAPGAFQGRCGHGPRLPLILVSPWAKDNYVDHTLTDQTSSLRFIEENWHLGFVDGPVPPPRGRESFDRIAGSIEGMLDFSQPRSERLFLEEHTGEVVR
jgi:phospholipase C